MVQREMRRWAEDRSITELAMAKIHGIVSVSARERKINKGEETRCQAVFSFV